MNIDKGKSGLLIAILGALLLLFIISIATISKIGFRISVQHAPLVDASMEIKFNAALFHLWFEELVSGDASIDEQKTWAFLDTAEWYAKALIEGGENDEGKFAPLDNPLLRGEVLKIFASIYDLRSVARKRLKQSQTSGIGSEIDQAFDKSFKKMLDQANNVETALQASIASDLRWYRVLSIGLFIGSVVLGIFAFFGITFYERQRTSDRTSLERNEKHLATTLNSIGDAVITTDTKGIVTRLNPVAEEMTGWEAKQALGKPLDEIFEIYHNKTNKRVDSPVDRVLREGKTSGLGNHTVLISRSGEKRHISDSASPISDETNKLSGVVMVFRDETDKYAANEALQQLTADLETKVAERTSSLQDANQQLKSFAYSVSHDLKAPLRSILGFSQIISSRYKTNLPDEGQHYFDNIMEASKQMEQLIEDMLLYSRLGKDGLQKQPIPFDDILAQVQHGLAGRIEETGAQIRVKGEIPTILGDWTLLSQIFTNLINNAITYHKADKHPKIEIALNKDGDNVIISVADQGIGIAPQYHEKVFEIFQRLHNQADYPGTGIGLAIVKKSVEMLGGHVAIESAVDKGSRFILTLPAV